jgi:hypothetical protein
MVESVEAAERERDRSLLRDRKAGRLHGRSEPREVDVIVRARAHAAVAGRRA